MRSIRFTIQGKVKYGILENNLIRGIRGSPFTHFKGPGSSLKLNESTYELGKVRLLAPCSPFKIVGIELNYHSHAKEFKLPIPSVPLIFLKPSTAVIGPDDKIVLPRFYRRVDYEGELAVVIGKKAKDVPEEKVKDYVLGYTGFNDVSERYIQKEDGQWTRAKGYDTFAPMGPWIKTEVDPDDLKIETYPPDVSLSHQGGYHPICPFTTQISW